MIGMSLATVAAITASTACRAETGIDRGRRLVQAPAPLEDRDATGHRGSEGRPPHDGVSPSHGRLVDGR